MLGTSITLLRRPYVMALALALTACAPSPEPEELLARATQAMANGDAKAAMIDVKTMLQQEPESVAGRELLASVYAWQQDHAAAVEQLERAIELSDPPSPELLERLARTLADAGRWERLLDLESEGFFRSVDSQPLLVVILATAHAREGGAEMAAGAVDTLPDAESLEPHTRFALARYEILANGDTDRASEVLFALVEDSPDYAAAWSLLGDVQQLQRDPFSAKASYEKAAELNWYRISDRLNLISLRIQAGEFESAKAELKAVERLAPGSPGVNLSSGKLLLEEGRYADALDAFEKVLTAIPGHEHTTYLAAIANASAGNMEIAESQFSEFLSKNPTHFEANLRLAQLKLRDGDARAAEKVLRKMLDVYGIRTATVSLLALALSSQGQHAESARLYEELLASQEPVTLDVRRRAAAAALNAGRGERAVDLLEEAIESSGEQQLGTHAQLIGTLLASGDTEQARTAAERAKGLFPQDPEADLVLAQVAIAVGDDGAAREHLENVLARDPVNIQANVALAAAAFQEGDLEAAVSRLEDSLAAHPSNLGLLMSLAATKEQVKDYEAMRRYLQRAIEQHPEALEPRVAMARDLVNQKEAGDALAILQPLLQSRNAAEDPRVQRLLAASYLMLDRPSSAVKAAEALVELTPESVSALQLLATAQQAIGDNEGAAGSLSRAYELSPSSPRVAMAYADTLARLGRMAESAEVMDALPEEVSSTAGVSLARGRVAMAMGDHALAEERFRQAYDTYPASDSVLFLAESLWAQDRRAEAMELLGAWVETHSKDVAVRADYAARLLQLDREELATEEYGLLVEAAPDNALFLNNYAWLLRESDAGRALELAQRAKRLAPESGEVLDTLAMVHLARGDIDLALREIDNAAARLPGSVDIKRHRVAILRAAGRLEEAEKLQAELAKD